MHHLAVNLLVTLNILTPVGENWIMIINTLQSTGLTPSISISVFGINRRACFFKLLLVAKKNQCGAGPIAMYVCFVFLPNDENQRGRITRNIEKHAQA